MRLWVAVWHVGFCGAQGVVVLNHLGRLSPCALVSRRGMHSHMEQPWGWGQRGTLTKPQSIATLLFATDYCRAGQHSRHGLALL